MDRLYDILGSQANEMLPLQQPTEDQNAPGEERWSGWISTPDITRGKGDDIHVLINGRPVAAGPFLQAVRRGYKTRLMQGRHPLAVLNLTCPPGEVDVNVHPTKREVRLRHSWRVLERLERCIAHSLESIPTQPDATGGIPELRGLSGGQNVKLVETYLTPKEEVVKPDDAIQQAAGLTDTAPVQPPTLRSSPPAWAIAAGQQLALTGEMAEDAPAKEKPRPVSHSPLGQTLLPTDEEKPIAPALSSAERALHRHAGMGVQHSPSAEAPLEGVLNDLPPMEPLAQFANSYILVQAEDELLLIDQHALHERIRFERLRNSGQLWEPQSRLEALNLNLDARQSAVVDANQSRLHELGFHLERTDEEWHLKASPQLIEGEKIRSFFLDVLQDIAGDEGPLATIEAKKDHIAFMNACRGAVKANQSLTLPEMRRLLEDMRRIPNPWACVHGRPTSLRIPIDSLDHHFGRHG